MAITKPSNTFTRPFAESGSKNTIPANSLIGTTAGAASLADGFPPLTMTPLAAGGVPPSGKDMNGILNQISQHTAWMNAGGNYQFDAAIAASGGYPVGAIIYSNDWSASYRNVVAGNTTDFNAAPSSIGVSWLASPFVKKSGDVLSGVLKAKGGTGLNAGIKGDADTDTGIEWLSDGVLQTVINGVVRQNIQPSGTTFVNNGFKTIMQTDGNFVLRNSADTVLWDAFSGVTQAQRNADVVYNDATFVNVTGDTMSGVLRANAGTGLNAGIKGSADFDTGFEWLQDGVLQTVINGVVRQNIQPSGTTFVNNGFKAIMQTDGNFVLRNSADTVLWDAFSTYQKSDYGGSGGAGWYRTPHPSIATGIIRQWGITTAMGQDSTLAVSFPIAFPNACNFVMLTENGVMDGSGSGSTSVDLVTSSGFTIRKGTDVSHTVRWVAEGY